MARRYGIETAKQYAAPPELGAQGSLGGRNKSIMDHYVLSGDLVSGEFIEFGALPVGARVIDCRVVFTDLDGSGGTIDVGWEAGAAPITAETADADGFMADIDVTSAGSVSMFEDQSSRPGQYKKFTAPVKVGITLDGDTDATTGTIYFQLDYIID